MKNQIFDSVSEEILEAAKGFLPKYNKEELQERAYEIIVQRGLDFTVEKSPLLDGENPTPFFSIKRTDNGRYFGTCESGYMPFQNINLALLALIVSRSINSEISSGGSFSGGAWPYLQLEVGECKTFGKSGSKLQQYATTTTSHSLDFSLRFGYSDLLIVCQNTFHANNAIIGKQNTVRHTPNMAKRIKTMIKEAEEVRKKTKKACEIYAGLAKVQLTDAAYDMVVNALTKNVLQKNEVENFRTWKPAQITEEFTNKKTAVKLEQVNEALAVGIEQEGPNFWGLFNGVTYYTTHKYGGEESGSRNEEKFNGHLKRTENLIYSELVSALS